MTDIDLTKYGMTPASTSVPATSNAPEATAPVDLTKFGMVPVGPTPTPTTGHGASGSWTPEESEKPYTYTVDDGTALSRIKIAAEQAEQAVAGKHTWVDAVRQAYNQKAPSDESFWTGYKTDVNRFRHSGLLAPNNAILPQEEKDNPHLVNVQKGLGDIIQQSLTPDSILQVLSFGKLAQTLPTLASKAVSFVPALAEYGPRAATAAKAALAGVNWYFTEQQISDAIKNEPRIISAFATGRTDDAIRGVTESLSNMAMGLYGAHESLRETGELIHNNVDNETLSKHPAFQSLVHDLQGQNQLASGGKDQIKRFADKMMSPAEQVWLTHFVEAGGELDEATARKLMAEHQKEAATGPKPLNQIVADQGKDHPISTTEAKPKVPVTVGSEGPDWERQFSAVNSDGKKVGSVGYKTDPNGNAKVYGAVVDEDLRGKGIGTEMYRNMIADAKAKGNKFFTSDPTNTTPDAMRVWESLKAEGYPVDPITQPDGKPGYKIDLAKLSPTGRPVEPANVHDLLNRAAADAHAYNTEYSEKDFRSTFSIPDTVDLSNLENRGLIRKNADGKYTVNEPTPGNPSSTPAAPAAVDAETQRLNDAIKEAQTAKKPPITQEERDAYVKSMDPNQKLTKGMQEYLKFRKTFMDRTRDNLVNNNLMTPKQMRANFVSHDYGFNDGPNASLARLFDTYHDAFMSGLRSPNMSIGDLDSDYYGKQGTRLANSSAITNFELGRAADGAPLAVHGGFTEGQKVVMEPQSHILGEAEIASLKHRGQFNDLVRTGRIVANPDKTFTLKADDYKPLGLYKQVPIGNTPIPAASVDALRESGALDALEKKGIIYHNDKGQYFHTEPLYSRVQLYGHPEIAPFFRDVIAGHPSEDTGFAQKVLDQYDKLGKNVKSLIVAWSPFHRVTESWRILNAMGFLKGGAHIVDGMRGVIDPPADIDYTNPDKDTADAIQHGILVANPRGFSESNAKLGAADTSEGLGAGEGTWGAKSYAIFNKTLEKMGIPANVRAKIDPEKILTENVFGPQGQITRAKFAAFKNLRPIVREAMKAANPNWSDIELDDASGRDVARKVNNKFGGFNNVLAGRSLLTQQWLRRVFFAPDFLETSMRSVLDLGSKYGTPLMTRMIQFQLAQALTAGAINYAIHRKPGDNSVEGGIEASHMLDHPGQIVSRDGKTLWSIRTAESDVIRMIKDAQQNGMPTNFFWNRISPFIKDGYEMATHRNEYGRRETTPQVAENVAKSVLPIPAQAVFNPNTVAEPKRVDNFLKSFGLQAFPNRSDAENLALQIFSQRVEGTPSLTGDKLVHQQLKLRAEDRLRDALHAEKKDPTEVNKATADIAHLLARNLITPKEFKDMKNAAAHSRLWGLFDRLGTDDALNVWDKASGAERRDIGGLLDEKFITWNKNHPAGRRTQDDQKTFQRFQQAKRDESAARTEAMRQNVMGDQAPPVDLTKYGMTPVIDLSKYGMTPVIDLSKYGMTPVGPYDDYINTSAKKYGVSSDLLHAMMNQESKGNPNAVSNKGAIGLMQLKPATAKQYGVTDIKNPEQNIDAGAHYMADLLKRYHGDQKKALAAYNAGPTAVEEYGGVPPFDETEGYVKKVTKAAREAKKVEAQK